MKIVLLFIIVGVLVFLYLRKNNEKKTKTMREDSNHAYSESDIEEQTASKDGIVSTAKTEVAAFETSEVEAEQEPSVEDQLKETVEPEQQASVAETAETEAQLDWANLNLTKALEQRQAASNAEQTYDALVAAISECYKQRKSQQYLIYGYSLADNFVESFEQYLAYRAENNIDTILKGTVFMQLATLAQDNGNFEYAITLCNRAIANDLSDGTVTGFEGRIKRIEKAKQKAAS